MSGGLYYRHLERAVTFFLRDPDLADGPILIVLALQNRDRHPDIGEVFADIPAAKFRIKPCVVPTVECIVDMAVPARQPRPQIGGFKTALDRGDRGHRYIFDDE